MREFRSTLYNNVFDNIIFGKCSVYLLMILNCSRDNYVHWVIVQHIFGYNFIVLHILGILSECNDHFVDAL